MMNYFVDGMATPKRRVSITGELSAWIGDNAILPGLGLEPWRIQIRGDIVYVAIPPTLFHKYRETMQ
jgi:hypothetical protein